MKIFYWHGYGWTWIVQPDIKAIKKRIEDLITRDYLERDKENPNMFKYLAWFECWSQGYYLGYAGSTGTWIRNLGFCCIWYATLKILGFWKEWIIFVQCAIKASFVQFTIFSREFNGNWFLKSLCTAIRLFVARKNIKPMFCGLCICKIVVLHWWEYCLLLYRRESGLR